MSKLNILTHIFFNNDYFKNDKKFIKYQDYQCIMII